MRRTLHFALAITSLLVISSAAAHAQALAPSTLHLTSPEQETKKDIVQTITKEPAQAITKEPAQAMTKKPIKAITQKAAQAIPKDSTQTFAIEPVRPMDQQSTSAPRRPAFHFSFKSSQGKKESAPIITQYYPKQIV